MRNVPLREWEGVLKANGYSKTDRGKGSHIVWTKKGYDPISVPYEKKEVNGAQVKGLVKRNNLIIKKETVK